MNLRENIDRIKGMMILFENSDTSIEKLIDKFYDVKYVHGFSPHTYFNLRIDLIPKKESVSEMGEINFYSTWYKTKNTVKNYDTMSPDKYGIFKSLGLKKELKDWLYEKSKEFVMDLDKSGKWEHDI